MLIEYAIKSKFYKQKKRYQIFILLQQQRIEYILHLYMMKNILELMVAWQSMLYSSQLILNLRYQMRNANYLENKSAKNFQIKQNQLQTNIPSWLSKWTLINIAILKSISAKFKYIINQCADCDPWKDLRRKRFY